jgi:hypothetical protein
MAECGLQVSLLKRRTSLLESISGLGGISAERIRGGGLSKLDNGFCVRPLSQQRKARRIKGWREEWPLPGGLPQQARSLERSRSRVTRAWHGQLLLDGLSKQAQSALGLWRLAHPRAKPSKLIERRRIVRLERRRRQQSQRCIGRAAGKAVSRRHPRVAIRPPRLQADCLAKFPQRVIQTMAAHVDRAQRQVHICASGWRVRSGLKRADRLIPAGERRIHGLDTRPNCVAVPTEAGQRRDKSSDRRRKILRSGRSGGRKEKRQCEYCLAFDRERHSHCLVGEHAILGPEALLTSS